MSLSHRDLPKQLLAAEEAAGKCQLPCDELIKPEHFGTITLTHNQREYVENNMRARIEQAQTVTELDKARQNLDCLQKWQRKCIPDLMDVEQTRKRVGRSGQEMEQELAASRAQELTQVPVIVQAPPVPAPIVVYTYEGAPGVSVMSEADRQIAAAAKRAKAQAQRRKMDWER